MRQRDLKEVFLYEPTVDSKLVYKATSGRRMRGDEVRSWVGNQQGHHYCTFGGKSVILHRVIWILHNGDIPAGYVIDHINRRPSDNRIENLRLATKSENKLNTNKKSKKSAHEFHNKYVTRKYVDENGKTKRRYELVTIKTKVK